MTEITTRRSVLTKIGVGTAVVWTAPTVLSLPAVAAASSAPPTTGSISGQVTVNSGGREGATVSLFDENGVEQQTTTSGQDGLYAFAVVPNGTWRVGVTVLPEPPDPTDPTRYYDNPRPFWSDQFGLATADPIVVASTSVPGININLPLNPIG